MTIAEIKQNPGLFLRKYNEAHDRITELNRIVANKQNRIQELQKKVIEQQPKPDRNKVVSDADKTMIHTFEIISTQYNTTLDAVKSGLRVRHVAEARHLLCYFMHKHYKISCNIVGGLIGGRDHSTALHSCTKVEDLCFVDKQFKAKFDIIKACL